MKIESYFSKSSVFLLIVLGKTAQESLNKRLSALELSYFQSLILVAIHVEEKPTLTMRDLTKVFPLTKGAISQHMCSLEEKKLLKRRRARDKRAEVVELTKKGNVLVTKIMTLLETYEQNVDTLIDISMQKKLHKIGKVFE